MGEGARFRLPKTLDEDPDVDIQGIPWTLTQSEWTFVILAAGSGFMVGQMLGSGIASILFLILLPLGTAQFITRYKSRLDNVTRQSWLFDLRYKLNGVKGRGWMIYRKGIHVLSAANGPMITPFVSGAKKPGEDLTLSRPWMRHRQPVVNLRPLVTPRGIKEAIIGKRRSPAPVWWRLNEEEMDKNPRPSIPVATEYRVVADKTPVSEDV